MNREIKFEAYVPSLGLVLKNVTVYANGDIGISSEHLESSIKGKFKVDDEGSIFDLTEDRNHIMNLLPGDDWYWVEGGSFSLRQYTGLKDKDGKEIYEWDILSWMSPKKLYPSADYEEQRGVVYFHETDAAFYVKYKEYPCLSMTLSQASIVIGSIYENKDLLK